MSNVRIGYSPTFTAGIHLSTGVVMNTFSVDIQLMTSTTDNIDQNIALERIKYILFEQLADSIIIGEKDKKESTKFADAGFRTIVLPDEPADQLIGLAIWCKIEAITKDVMEIIDISIRSNLGGGICYLHNEDESLGPYDKDGWWNDPSPNCVTLPNTKKKVVSLTNPTWKSLNLEWNEGEVEEEIIVEVKLEKNKEKVDFDGENIVEFKPNDKK